MFRLAGGAREFPPRLGIDWMKGVGHPPGSRYRGSVCPNNCELSNPVAVILCIGIGKLDTLSRRGLIKLGYEFGLSLKRSLMRFRVDVLEPDVKKHTRRGHGSYRAY